MDKSVRCGVWWRREIEYGQVSKVRCRLWADSEAQLQLDLGTGGSNAGAWARLASLHSALANQTLTVCSSETAALQTQHWSAARALPVLIRARGRSSCRAPIARFLLYFCALVGCFECDLAQRSTARPSGM